MPETFVMSVKEARPHTTKRGRKCVCVIDGNSGEYYYDFRRNLQFYQENTTVKVTIRDGSKIIDEAEPVKEEEQKTIPEARQNAQKARRSSGSEQKGFSTPSERDAQIAKLSVLRAICEGFDKTFFAKVQTDDTITITAENIVKLWKKVTELAQKEGLI